MSGTRTDGTSRADLLRACVAIAGEERSLRSLLRQTAKLVVSATAADACFVHVVDDDAGDIVLMGATPDEFDALAGTIRLALGEGVAGWVALHGEPLVVDDKWSDPRYRYIPALRGENYVSLVSVPLLRPSGAVVGVLNVHARAAGHFGGDVLSRLEEVASLLSGIVEVAMLHEQLRTREEQLERFAARTIEMQEVDRRRIAGDIHDGISQRLVSAWYHVGAARALAADDDVRAELAAVEELLSGALEEARAAIGGLRPSVLDDLGLTAAITSLAHSAGGDFAVELDLQECSLPPHVEMSVYRITQEALQNIVKHAAASHVELSLRSTQDGVTLTVRDDGLGFDTAAAGGPLSFGLNSMHERASLLGARLSVRSSPGQGTTLTLVLPPSVLCEDDERGLGFRPAGSGGLLP